MNWLLWNVEAERFLMSSKLRIELQRGCIRICGATIDTAAERDWAVGEVITEHHVLQKCKRDGTDLHHVTLITAAELNLLIARAKSHNHHATSGLPISKLTWPEFLTSIVDDLATVRPGAEPNSEQQQAFNSRSPRLPFSSPWEFLDLGVGMLKSATSTTYFKVLLWPALNHIRTAILHLQAKIFHVTLGFADGGDVHDPADGKGVRSLAALRFPDDEGCNQIEKWVVRDEKRLAKIVDIAYFLQNLAQEDRQLIVEDESFESLVEVGFRYVKYIFLQDDSSIEVRRLLNRLLHLRLMQSIKAKDYLSLLHASSDMMRFFNELSEGYIRHGCALQQMGDVEGAVEFFWRGGFRIFAQDYASSERQAEIGGELDRVQGENDGTTPGKVESFVVKCLIACLRTFNIRIDLVPQQLGGGEATELVSPRGLQLYATLSDSDKLSYHRLLNSVVGDLDSSALQVPLKNNLPTETRFVVQFSDLPYRLNVPHLLPRFFSWVIPYFLAGMSTPRNGEDVLALQSIGVRLVVTLTEEQPLPASWFHNTSLRNVFYPVPNYQGMESTQVESLLVHVIAEALANVIRGGFLHLNAVVVHCGGGKGRAGTVLACYMVRFGFQRPRIKCDQCVNEQQQEQERPYCPDDSCLFNYEPRMSATEAVALIRKLRPGSVETDEQEEKVSDYASWLWKVVARRIKPSVATTTAQIPAINRSPPCLSKDASNEELSSIIEDMTSLQICNNASLVVGRPLTCLPTFIILCGLPGSGKTTFSTRLQSRFPTLITRISQDDMGSRKAVERVLPGQMKQARCVILDRCNPALQERRYFHALAFKPKDAVIMYFSRSWQDCVGIVNQRVEHPTVKAGMGRRVVQSFVKKLEGPRCDDLGGRGTVVECRNWEEIDVACRIFEELAEKLLEERSSEETESIASKWVLLPPEIRADSNFPKEDAGGQKACSISCDSQEKAAILSNAAASICDTKMKVPQRESRDSLVGSNTSSCAIPAAENDSTPRQFSSTSRYRPPCIPPSVLLKQQQKMLNEDWKSTQQYPFKTDILSTTGVTQLQTPSASGLLDEHLPRRMPKFHKFPRTPHLFDPLNHAMSTSHSNPSLAISRSDLILPPSALANFFFRQSPYLRLTLEEKVDGANIGFSVDEESGKIMVQNRSHYVNAKEHWQFSKIDAWIDRHTEEIRWICEGKWMTSKSTTPVVGNGRRRWILYGEWLYAKHSINYTQLPDFFLAFDICDPSSQEFMSRTEFHAVISRTGLHSAPEFEIPDGVREFGCAGMVNWIVDDLLQRKSRFAWEQRVEGVYMRVDDERSGVLVSRAKVVRPDFIAGNERWNKGDETRNVVRSKLKHPNLSTSTKLLARA